VLLTHAPCCAWPYIYPCARVQAVDKQQGLRLRPRDEPPLVPGRPMQVFFKPEEAQAAPPAHAHAGGDGRHAKGGGTTKAGATGHGTTGATSKENRAPHAAAGAGGRDGGGGGGGAGAGAGASAGAGKRAHCLSDVESSEDERPLAQRQKQVVKKLAPQGKTPPAHSKTPPAQVTTPLAQGGTPHRGTGLRSLEPAVGLSVADRPQGKAAKALAAELGLPPPADGGSAAAPIDLLDEDELVAAAGTTHETVAEPTGADAGASASVQAGGADATAAERGVSDRSVERVVLVSPWSSDVWLTQEQIDVYVSNGAVPDGVEGDGRATFSGWVQWE
jgi:hypothetical protein